MTESWFAQMGPNGTLEENWIRAESGSIAAMVRMTGGGSTAMIEVLVIEESEDSLVLNWKPPMALQCNLPSMSVNPSLYEAGL